VSRLRALDDVAAACHATGFLRAFGHAVVGWQWLDRALLCLDASTGDSLRAGKPWACRYFCERELPKIAVCLASLENGSTLLAEIPEDLL